MRKTLETKILNITVLKICCAGFVSRREGVGSERTEGIREIKSFFFWQLNCKATSAQSCKNVPQCRFCVNSGTIHSFLLFTVLLCVCVYLSPVLGQIDAQTNSSQSREKGDKVQVSVDTDMGYKRRLRVLFFVFLILHIVPLTAWKTFYLNILDNYLNSVLTVIFGQFRIENSDFLKYLKRTSGDDGMDD